MKFHFEKNPYKKEKSKLSIEIKEKEKFIDLTLKEISNSLRERGFLVDSSCRLNLEELAKKDIYSPLVVKRDIKRAEKKREIFRQEEKSLLKKGKTKEWYLKKIGGIVEKLKTISFNNFWFKGKFFALRTSLYDDYFNGIDQIILDANPKKPKVLAAIDTTSLKGAWQEKAEKIIKKIKNPERIKIDYGVLARKEKNTLKIEYKELKGIPLLILAFKENEEEILKWFGALENRDKNYLNSLLKEQLAKLKEQCKIFSQIAHPSLKKEYCLLEKFFEKEKNL